MPDQSATPPTKRWSDDPTRKWRKRRRRLRRRFRRAPDILLVVLVVAAVFIVVRRSSSTSSATAQTTTTTAATTLDTSGAAPAADVKVTDCAYADDAAIANLSVTNHLALDQSYVIKVTFDDGRTVYAQAVVTIDHLAAGGSQKALANGVSTKDPPTQLTCHVTDVERFR